MSEALFCKVDLAKKYKMDQIDKYTDKQIILNYFVSSQSKSVDYMKHQIIRSIRRLKAIYRSLNVKVEIHHFVGLYQKVYQ
jgi:hypothetical protein